MARFAAIPNIATEGIPDEQALALTAMKENLELLAGTRGGRSRGMRAVLKDEIKIEGISPNLSRPIGTKQMTVQGQGYEINEVQVPSMTDFVRLANDVVETKQDIVALAEELSEIRRALSTLIEQLRR